MNRRLVLISCALLAALPAAAHNGVDDEPHHGGVVRPYKDLHLEIAVLPAGGVQIYFSDAMGEPMPASIVPDVDVEIAHPGKTGAVDMTIDRTGVFWEGKAPPLTDSQATLRVGFVYRAAPGMVEVPAAKLIAAAKKGPPKKAAGKTHGH